MKIAVGHVVRADHPVGRRQIGNRSVADLDFLLGGAAGLDPLLPLLDQAGREPKVVAGVEEETVGGPFAEEHIRADQGHVGDRRIAQQPREHSLLRHELRFDAAAHAAVQAAQGNQVLAVAAPLGQRVLQPEEVGEAAEMHVKAFGRHALGNRLDRDVGGRLRHAEQRRIDRLGQRLIGRLAQIVQPENAVLLHRRAERLGAEVQAQLAAQLPRTLGAFVLLPGCEGSAAGRASWSNNHRPPADNRVWAGTNQPAGRIASTKAVAIAAGRGDFRGE